MALKYQGQHLTLGLRHLVTQLRLKFVIWIYYGTTSYAFMHATSEVHTLARAREHTSFLYLGIHRTHLAEIWFVVVPMNYVFFVHRS